MKSYNLQINASVKMVIINYDKESKLIDVIFKSEETRQVIERIEPQNETETCLINDSTNVISNENLKIDNTKDIYSYYHPTIK